MFKRVFQGKIFENIKNFTGCMHSLEWILRNILWILLKVWNIDYNNIDAENIGK